MKGALSLPAPAEPADRLAATFCLALILHVMLVLGISFRPELHRPPPTERLDITLVTERATEAPKEVDALAQANLQGGGQSEERVRPTTPLAAPSVLPVPALEAAPPESGQQAEAPAPPSPAPVAPKAAPSAPRKREPSTPLAPPRVAAIKPAAKPDLPRPAPSAVPAPPSETATAPPVPAPAPGAETETLPTATQLITRSFALASMSAELQDKMENRARRARSKYISASTQEYRYAAYMEAWRAKVERIGNINYPDEARQRGLSGALLLDVALRPDGSVIEIVVRRSSGHKVLDDAAVRIVELAGPFAPFPPDIAREVDVLHVTRTWRFLNSAEFTAQ